MKIQRLAMEQEEKAIELKKQFKQLNQSNFLSQPQKTLVNALKLTKHFSSQDQWGFFQSFVKKEDDLKAAKGHLPNDPIRKETMEKLLAIFCDFSVKKLTPIDLALWILFITNDQIFVQIMQAKTLSV